MVKHSRASRTYMRGSAHHSEGAPPKAKVYWRSRTSHLLIERTISGWSGFSWVQPGKGGERAPLGGAPPQTKAVEVKNILHYRTFVLNQVL